MALAQMPHQFEKLLARQFFDCALDFLQTRHTYKLSQPGLVQQAPASTGPRPRGRGIGSTFEPQPRTTTAFNVASVQFQPDRVDAGRHKGEP
jgi:hypothetical protein